MIAAAVPTGPTSGNIGDYAPFSHSSISAQVDGTPIQLGMVSQDTKNTVGKWPLSFERPYGPASGTMTSQCGTMKIDLHWTSDLHPQLTGFDVNQRPVNASDLARVNEELNKFEYQPWFAIVCVRDMFGLEIRDNRSLRHDLKGHIRVFYDKGRLKIDPGTLND